MAKTRGANSIPGNPLPTQLTSFIGREREMAEVLRLLTETRLLTLTGPGGSGKTRLATEVARAIYNLSPAGNLPESQATNDDLKSNEDGTLRQFQIVLRQFKDGIWWIELASLSDALLVPQAVAFALGVREQPGRTLIQTLTAELATRQALLIFDNCEHLVAACADLAFTLLGACPGLRILATSREPLGVLGETLWPVPPLSVPSPHPSSITPQYSALLHSDAVRLFVERARQAQPTFALTDENAQAVAQICRRLDGIPLALELAAARVRVLNVSEMATRLDDIFRLLAGAPRNLPPRHQTLRATVDWSYNLLSESERRLFRRLSVFSGGFSLAAVETVCSDTVEVGQNSILSSAILDLLMLLIDKSLVAVDTSAGPETRYRLLETIRQYSREKLGDEGPALRQRHLLWCMALAEQAEPLLHGPRIREWLTRLEREHDNFRTALAYGLETRDLKTEENATLASSSLLSPLASLLSSLRLAGAIGWFWTLRGYLSEGRHWLEDLLQATQSLPADAPSAHDPSLKPARAKALHYAGILAIAQGDLNAAAGFLQAGLTLNWELGDPRPIARTLMTMGAGVVWQGQPAAARSLIEQSLTFFRRTDDRWGTAAALAWLGEVSRGEGHYAQARQEYDESLRLFEAIDDPWGECWPLIGQAHLALQQGDYAQAGALYDHCLPIFREFGERWGLGATLNGVAEVARGLGDQAQAVQVYREALDINRQIGFQYGAALSLTGLALCAAPTQAESAVQLLSAAFALMASIGAQMDPSRQAHVERAQTDLKAILGDVAYGLVWSQGRLLTLDQAVDLARQLDLTPPAASIARPPVPSMPLPSLQSPVVSISTDHRLRLLALGPAQVFRDGQALSASDWPYTKPKELLFYLVSHGRQTKEQIGLALWPDASSSQLRSNFRTALYHLRRALGDTDWILFEDDHYSFNRGMGYWYDAEEFEKGLREARALKGANSTHPSSSLSTPSSLASLVELYRGDFLVDMEAGEWLDLKREEMRRLYLDALLNLGSAQFEQAHYADAATTYRRAITQDSYLETAHRELMRCLTRLGEPGQALRHYQTLSQLLNDELGAPPAPETTSLYDRLRRGETDI